MTYLFIVIRHEVKKEFIIVKYVSYLQYKVANNSENKHPARWAYMSLSTQSALFQIQNKRNVQNNKNKKGNIKKFRMTCMHIEW